MSGYIPKKVRNGILGTKKDQKGLKTHGSPATLGGHRFVSNVIKRRVAPLNAPWLPRAPFNQSIAGGVGRINAPRFKCGTNCFGHNCDYPPSEVDINTIQQFFKHKDNNVEYTTICWDRVECADDYYVCFYDSDFHLVLSKTVEDNAIVLWLDDEKNYKIKYFSVQACNTHGCSELYYVNVLSCDPLKTDKDSKSISSNEYVPIDATYHKAATGSEQFYLISLNWLFNDNFYTSDIYDVTFRIDSDPPVSIKDSVWLHKRYTPIEKFYYEKSYNFELQITCYYGTHKYSGNFFVKPPPSPIPPPHPHPIPPHENCNCTKILPLDNFQFLPYPTTPVDNYYGLSITRNDHNDSDCLKYITSYKITVEDTDPPGSAQTFTITGNIFGSFILTNTSVSTTPQLDRSFTVSNDIDTKIYKHWPSLIANHEYKITIISNLTDKTQCSIESSRKTQELPSPPPSPPTPPTPGDCCSCPTKISDASLCNLYITMYGNSSFDPVKKIFENTLPSKATALANWRIIKDWFSTIGDKYVQFIKNFKNTKYIAWNATDHAVIFPPTSQDLPTDLPKNVTVKNYTTGATTFNSPNGSILVGVSGDDINEASKPLILTEFLVPLQKTLYNRNNITDLSYIELAYDIFPDPKDAFFAMDIGSYSQADTRFGPSEGDFPITDTTSLYRIPWINKSQFKEEYRDKTGKKLKKYQNGNIYIGNGQEGDPFANPKVLPSESYCGRAAFYYHDLVTNTIKFQEANGTYGTINQKDINDASGSPTDQYNYQNSHPLDNMHQYFITIYLTNQKIMEYNHNNQTNNNQNKKVPLITSLSLDGEGAGQYLDDGPKNTYPAADQDTGELTALKFFTTKYPHATKIKCGLGDEVGIGYVNYLYNRYMPAECLPEWRVNPSNKPNQPGKNTTAHVPNMYDFSQNYQNKMKLWDPSYPWNTDQQRNFSAEAGVNYKTGTSSSTSPDISFNYANTTRNYNWKKIKSTNDNRKYGTKLIYPGTMHTSDGIQRYNLATIKYQGNAFKRNNEGFWHSFIEAYNIGENQPPIYALPTNVNKPTNIFEKYDPNDMTINGGNQGDSIDTNKIGLPIVGSNNIISNFNNKLGSGCYTGLNITCSALPPPNIRSDCSSVETPAPNPTKCPKKCPIRSTLIPDSCTLNSNVYFCPCTDNIIGDHFKRNCITNTIYIKMLNSYKCREGYSQTGTPDAKSPAISDIYMRFSTSDRIPPLDGRGFKDLTGLTTLKATEIKNGTKDTDGCYCPLDFPFVQPPAQASQSSQSLKWDISLNNSFYKNDIVKNDVDGRQDINDGSGGNGNNQNIGPIGNVLVLQFAYMGATFTKNPSQPGPQYDNTKKPTWPSGAIYKKQGKTFQQDVFGSLMGPKSQWDEKSWPPYDPITNSKAVGPGGDNWKDNGTIQKTSMGYGDNTNAFGIIEDVNTVQNLMYGLSNIMCGPDHQSRANIGIYSIEFVNNKLTADEGLANF